MSDESTPAVSPAPASQWQPPPAPEPASQPPRVALLVAIAALLIAAVAWYQSHLALNEVREGRTNAAAGQDAPRIPIAGAPSLGNATARVALVEFSDYECPYCIRHFQQTMPKISEAYVKTGRIRYVFRDWPVDQLHPESIRAHEAAHCAGEQKRYWEMHARLFGPAGSHTADRLLGLAREAGLDMDAFGRCVESRRSDDAIRETSQMAVSLGANGTPTFFIGVLDAGQNSVTVLKGLSGAQPYEVFARELDAALDRVR